MSTALTKALIAVHERNPAADHTEMDRIHQEIVNDFKKTSGFFRSFVIPFDTEKLKSSKNYFFQRISNDIASDFSADTVTKSNRAMENYALCCSSLKQLLLHLGIDIGKRDELEEEMYQFIISRCLPMTLRAIEIAIPKNGIARIPPTDSSMKSELLAYLSKLSFREFFEVVGITPNQIHIARELFTKTKLLRLKDCLALFHGHYSLLRCLFLSLESDCDWFLRKRARATAAESDCAYGKYSKLQGYVIPIDEVWPELKAVIVEKVKEAIPSIQEAITLKEVYQFMNSHFDPSLDIPFEDGEKGSAADQSFFRDFSQLTDSSKDKVRELVQSLLSAATDVQEGHQESSNNPNSNEGEALNVQEPLPDPEVQNVSGSGNLQSNEGNHCQNDVAPTNKKLKKKNNGRNKKH